MGILNITPDSFSDGGQFNSDKNALQQAEKMIEEGASIIDIGAQSTRPNADLVTADEEIKRLGKIISSIKKEFPEIWISVDSFYSKVIRFAEGEGMDIVNDISGGQFDSEMFQTVGELGLPYVLMHCNSSYANMHEKIEHEDIILELNRYFSEKTEKLLSFGVNDIILDPGFGFGKTVEHQYQMIDEFQYIGLERRPVLAGISRKSFIYKPLGKQPNEINKETQQLHLKLLEKGAKILRVHDVAKTRKTIEYFTQL